MLHKESNKHKHMLAEQPQSNTRQHHVLHDGLTDHHTSLLHIVSKQDVPVLQQLAEVNHSGKTSL